MKVFINKHIPDNGIQMLKDAGLEVNLLDVNSKTIEEDREKFLQQADACINAGLTPINAAFFDRYPNIKAFSQFSVGYNNVDIAEATKRKIPIGNTPDVLSKATSDVAFLLMIFVSRYGTYYFEKVKNGNWNGFDMKDPLGVELYGKTLGILGLGRIGYEMAKKCKAAYDMNIVYHNRHTNEKAEQELGATLVSFDELLQKSDVISVHANFTPDQADLFNRDAFSKMKPKSIFVNTARGGFHNEKDLYTALTEGKLFGAGLDVTNPEPISKDSPLLTLPNVCVFPHIGSSTVEAREGMSRYAAENIIAALKGEKMPHIVNPEVYQ